MGTRSITRFVNPDRESETHPAVACHVAIFRSSDGYPSCQGALLDVDDARSILDPRRQNHADAQASDSAIGHDDVDPAVHREAARGEHHRSDGQHAKVQVVIDSWRERQDAQLVEVLRELEQLTRPVGEA